MTKAKATPKNVISYFVGNLRYHLYYSRFRFLIRTHIQEQIDFRIKFMRRACYEKGECVLCGCQTTALQMANKACDAPCYPAMLTPGLWSDFKKGFAMYEGNFSWRLVSETELVRKQYIGTEQIVTTFNPSN